MKILRASYTILMTMEVADDITEEDCAEIVDEFAADCGFENYVNDREWDLSDN